MHVPPRLAPQKPRNRPLIAFFDYPDVFEDFYPHYGVDQRAFATQWTGTGNHAFVTALQREVGDVIWHAFSLAPELDGAYHAVTGCQVRFLSSSWFHRQLWHWFYLSRSAWRWRRAYPAYAVVASYLALLSYPFFKMLRRDRPDFFFVQDYATGRFDVLLLLARALRVPLIAYHSGSHPDRYVGRLAKRWTIPHADALIASSGDELEMLAKRYRVPRERLVVILTPIDTSTLRPLDRSEACQAAKLDPARRYLLFVGRLDDPVKRVSVLIRTFAGLAGEHPHVDLLIAGQGPDKEKLCRLAEEQAPGRVRFLGWVSRAEAKARLYNVADCLMLNSRSEGFPTVVGEAMACGTPVLSSQVGGVAELVVEGETGWLFPPGDEEALRAKMAYVMSRPEAVTAMRPQVRILAERRVSPEVVGAALRSCFEKARQHGRDKPRSFAPGRF
jgi:glycosyltransferase involved in cell wall biosynthesis